MQACSTRDHFNIFLALLRRDLWVFKKKFRSELIDASIILVVAILICRKFLPLFGMPTEFITDIFIGGYLIIMLMSMGFSFAMNISYALPHGHLIEYQLTLPLPKYWVLSKYILFFIIQTFIVTLPLISVGIIFVNPTTHIGISQWLLFCGTYIFALLFISTFFLSLCFSHDYHWFKENTWPRRLSPMICLTAAFTPWKKLHAIFPIIGKLFLLNPITFICEALRASLFGGNNYLPLSVCLVIISCWIVIFFWKLTRGISKQLDPI